MEMVHLLSYDHEMWLKAQENLWLVDFMLQNSFFFSPTAIYEVNNELLSSNCRMMSKKKQPLMPQHELKFLFISRTEIQVN